MDEHIPLGALPKCLPAAQPFWAIAASISTYDQRDKARRDDLPRDAVESVFGSAVWSTENHKGIHPEEACGCRNIFTAQNIGSSREGPRM
jgi:hypothetical protein